MIIAIGSTNPVKVTAVTAHIVRVWPEAQVIPVAVPSGVSAMPLSDTETISGAQNRARAAREAIGADMGIGLEGGVHPEPFGWVLQGWVAIVAADGRTSLGGCARLPLPVHIAKRVQNGEELGHVMDDVLNDHNTKQKGGAVGALTNNLVVRGEAFATAVAYALAPFVSQHLYGNR